MRTASLLVSLCSLLAACSRTQGTDPPPDGWANNAPTQVVEVVDRDETQLLSVQQGTLTTWIEVPKVNAEVGDYVLLGQGAARTDVPIPELDRTASVVVDIAHIQVVDEETARKTVVGRPPPDAVPVGTLYAELAERADQPVVVYGTAVKVSSAIGSVWVHIQDGTGNPAAGTHDITVEASEPVTVGQRVAYRGTLRKDVDLGFGYEYDAMVRDAEQVE